MSTPNPRKVTAEEAYARAMMVLEDLHVACNQPGTTLDVEHAEIRLKLAASFANLGDSIGYQAAARQDED